MSEIKFAINLTLILIVMIILTGFCIVLAIILIIALRTAGRITKAIDVMTEYTGRLKLAPNVDSKKNIIAQMSQDPVFSKTSEKFKKMKLAKQALVNRY